MSREGMTYGSGSPCGACKFLRRKCVPECVFAPYFVAEDSPAVFAAIHRVFGASNVSKLLRRIPPSDRRDAVVGVAFEAQARIADPVYGCVAHVFALQQQVASLQAQVMQERARMGIAMADHQRQEDNFKKPTSTLQTSFSSNEYPSSRQSSRDSASLKSRGEVFLDGCSTQQRPRKRSHQAELGEFRNLAMWKMRE
ncbi:LOB domain-containing protein 16-like [Wolffia australiana]